MAGKLHDEILIGIPRKQGAYPKLLKDCDRLIIYSRPEDTKEIWTSFYLKTQSARLLYC